MRVSRKDNVYADHSDEIFQNSPKLLLLRSFIEKLQITEDYAQNEQKFVIVSHFPTIAFIVKLVRQCSLSFQYPESSNDYPLGTGHRKICSRWERECWLDPPEDERD